MRGGNADELLVCKRGLDEDLRVWLPIFGQIVIAKRSGRIGIVEVYELPIRRLRDLRIVELHRIAPDRDEVEVVAFLQGGGELVEGYAEVNRRVVDARDADRAALPGLGRTDGLHGNLLGRQHWPSDRMAQ